MRAPGAPWRLVWAHGLSATAMAMPWPALLALVWEQTHSSSALALTGAARVVPYVALSWYAGNAGDRFARDRVVRVVTHVRVVLLGLTALALIGGHLAVAVVVATLTVAVGTPAYPTIAAALPDLAGAGSDRVTRWLVTAEVTAFTAGPALAGLLLARVGAVPSVAAACAVALAGSLVLAVTPWRPVTTGSETAVLESNGLGWRAAVSQLVIQPAALRAVATVSVVNLILGATAVGLLTVFAARWDDGAQGYGLAMAAVGLGALAAPGGRLLLRLPEEAQAAALLWLCGSLLAVAVSPEWWFALLPLAVVGLTATQVESVVTTTLQHLLPQHARASALGITDTAMVAANLVGAAAAPFLVAAIGGTVFLLVLAVLAVATVPLTRSRARRVVVPDAGVWDDGDRASSSMAELRTFNP